jgi:hypothetical protein
MLIVNYSTNSAWLFTIIEQQTIMMRSRKEAKAIGERFYCDGKACKHGHRGLRYSSNGACLQCFASPRYRFLAHRAHAKARGIRFMLSYQQWLDLWGDKLPMRGRGLGRLCMARRRDRGGYQRHRVEIVAHNKNVEDGWDYKRGLAAD